MSTELESKIKSNAFNSELDDLYNKLEMAEKRVAEKEEKEAEKKRLEEKTKQQAAKENSLKEKYLQKADNLDNEIMNEAKKLFAHDLQPGFYGQYYSEWDNLLNEVWGELKTTMPKNAFEKLKSDTTYKMGYRYTSSGSKAFMANVSCSRICFSLAIPALFKTASTSFSKSLAASNLLRNASFVKFALPSFKGNDKWSACLFF